MSNKYCQALVELRNKPAHELKEVGDQWRTPDNIFWGINTLFGPFVLDLFTDGGNAKCAAYYTAEDNALAHDWSERLAELKGAAFGNPPYSRASQHEGQYITGMRYIMKHAYGGVVLNKEESDPPIDHKTLINTHKKELIAEAAVGFIHDGDSIILDAGSTVLQMVPLLSRFNNITVMTNSLHIVNALSELDNEQTILMPGGTFRKKSASFHGQLAENY